MWFGLLRSIHYFIIFCKIVKTGTAYAESSFWQDSDSAPLAISISFQLHLKLVYSISFSRLLFQEFFGRLLTPSPLSVCPLQRLFDNVLVSSSRRVFRFLLRNCL